MYYNPTGFFGAMCCEFLTRDCHCGLSGELLIAMQVLEVDKNVYKREIPVEDEVQLCQGLLGVLDQSGNQTSSGMQHCELHRVG